jgi:hypothetical protein
MRAGVPSVEAVAELGSRQIEIEREFCARLAPQARMASSGLIVGGGLGSGKSHLLHHLDRLATAEGFVVSKIVVSKETPLHDPAKVVRSALDTAVLPGHSGPLVEQVAAALKPGTPRFASLVRWAAAPEGELDHRFLASLLLYAELQDRDAEYTQALVRFWSGDAIQAPELRRRSRAMGRRFTFDRISPRELAPQRLRFAARLFAATGAAGWVLLFDEVELIGRYPLMLRAKAYSEIAGWVSGEFGPDGVPLVTVLTITDDFISAVLDGKRDREQIPARLAARQEPGATELSTRAERGMSMIAGETRLLSKPDGAELDRIYQRLKQLHGLAYDWEPPDVGQVGRAAGNRRMRQFVRAWIAEWDLRRLDPQYAGRVQVGQLDQDYAEDPSLAGSMDDLTPGVN